MKAHSHRRVSVSVFAALTTVTLLASPASNAASPPGTPHVTVGADIKQLLFDWDDVTGAAYYRLLVQVGTGAFKPLIDNIPASSTQVRLSIADHVLSWTLTHYAVAACNTSGCTNSAPLSPQNLMLDSIGYFKASNTETGDTFGELVLSDDGRTLAVVASSEDSNATGVNDNQASNSSAGSGAVYVFRRTSDGWRQEAYLKAGVNQPGQSFGTTYSEITGKAIAINAKGSLLAVGASRQNVAGIPEAGVVYIYQKSASGSLSLAATLNSPNPHSLNNFGGSLDMSLDGRTLKVTEIDPPPFESALPRFRTHIFIRPGTVWQASASFVQFRPIDFCGRTRLSRDGNTLVFLCINPILMTELLYTVKRSGNTWTLVSDQTPAEMGGKGLALDFDATTMAIQQLEDTDDHRRLVGIFRWTGSSWVREATIPAPPIPDALGSLDFGKNVELSLTGNMLAIGDPLASEGGAGISPASKPGTESRGAVYIWRRNDRNSTTWLMRSVVKSPNPGQGDDFGISLSMCSTGHALAIGADGEDSKAKGVDGDRTDNSSTDSGAAYLY